MKTVKEIRQELMRIIWKTDGLIVEAERQDKLLKEWASEIIEECAGSFECEMVEDESQEMSYEKTYHPVLIRQTVLDVKNKLL